MPDKSMVKKIKTTLFLGLVFAFLLWQYAENKPTKVHYLDQSGQEKTLVLPMKDKRRLTRFFEQLFAKNSFAYTILGSKPLAWETYRNPFPFSTFPRFRDSFSKYNRTLRSGWKTWEKYRHLFPDAPIVQENLPPYPGHFSILIINAKRFNDVVLESREDFELVLDRKILGGYQLLMEAEKESLMGTLLKGHQALLGIVLGYGRDNSWEFDEGCKNDSPIGCVWGDEERSYDGDRGTIEYYLSVFSCPSFAGDPDSQESHALKEEYILTKQRVLAYYRGRDFVEATLSLLAGYFPPPDETISR